MSSQNKKRDRAASNRQRWKMETTKNPYVQYHNGKIVTRVLENDGSHVQAVIPGGFSQLFPDAKDPRAARTLQNEVPLDGAAILRHIEMQRTDEVVGACRRKRLDKLLCAPLRVRVGPDIEYTLDLTGAAEAVAAFRACVDGFSA